MAAYIDDAFIERNVRYRSGFVRSRWCHLIADTHEELEEAARAAGLSPSWIQEAGTAKEHYDLTEERRERALKKGVIPITMREMVAIIQGKREAEKNTA